MNAISGTRRSMREMADGTIRVQIDIDPSCKDQFLSLFKSIDMPVAIAPLRADFEQRKPEEKLKGGELARLAGMFCQNADFLEWGNFSNESIAAEWVREMCGVDSRADIDHDIEAAARFHERVRKPFIEWKESRP